MSDPIEDYLRLLQADQDLWDVFEDFALFEFSERSVLVTLNRLLIMYVTLHGILKDNGLMTDEQWKTKWAEVMQGEATKQMERSKKKLGE